MTTNEFHRFSERIRQLGDGQLQQIQRMTAAKLETPFFPKGMILSNAAGSQEILDAICGQCGQAESLKQVLSEFRGSFVLSLRYGAGLPVVMQQEVGSKSYPLVQAALEWELLKTMELDWYSGIAFGDVNPFVMETVDVAVLASSAIFALTSEECGWIKTTLQEGMQPARMAAALYGKGYLNTREELDSVCKSSKIRLSRMHEDLGFCAGLEEIFPFLEECAGSRVSKQTREQQILTHYLNQTEQQLQRLQELASSQAGQAQAAIRTLEQERKRLETSGRLIMDVTIENMYADLQNQIVSAADQYNQDAYESIRGRMMTTKNVEKDAQSIVPYLNTVWKKFEDEVQERFISERMRMAETLQQQIETDREAMLSALSSTPELQAYLGKSVQVAARVDDWNTPDGQKQAKLLSRGMLVASVCLAFVSPFWGLTAFVGSQIYQKKQSDTTEELRKAVLNGLFNECVDAKKNAVSRIVAAIQETKASSKENIMAIYAEAMDAMVDTLVQAAEELRKLQDNAAQLRQITEVEIPALR